MITLKHNHVPEQVLHTVVHSVLVGKMLAFPQQPSSFVWIHS